METTSQESSKCGALHSRFKIDSFFGIPVETLRVSAAITIIHLFFFLTAGFTDWQANTIRASIKKYGAPDAVFIDVAMAQDYAHTDVERRIVSIDARRFDCCPNTFQSVVHHELEHTRGRMHCRALDSPTAIIPGLPWCGYINDPMGYVLTTDAQGYIVEDPISL